MLQFRASLRIPPRLALAGLIFLASAGTLLAQAPNVLTWRYDNTHQGQNTQESILTPTNVNTNTFGKLFSQVVDGEVYAQPLYVGNLTLPNQTTHNVFFIADEHDSVYAFDADSNGGADSSPLWQASMLSTAHGAAAGATTVPSTDVQSGIGDINPEIGISATPVIDINTQTLFVVAKSKENGNYVQRLHALSILDGSERAGSPVAISGSVPGNGNGSSGGTLAFSPLWQNNRVALGLFNGNIYLGFGSHGDEGPWHGWILVYNETTLNQTGAFCTSPNGDGDGIWMSGAGLPIDTVSTNGRAFLVAGNGDLTSYPPITGSVDYGESILRFDLSNGGFAPTDAFTPFNQATLSGLDLDQSSGGVLILPDQPGANPHLLIQVGKEGRILVLNRDNLNGYAPGGSSNTNAVQDITGALAAYNGLWSTPAYWNGNVYMWARNDGLKMFPITNGVLATSATVTSSVTSSFPGASVVVSSNGTQNGIAWALVTDLYTSNGSTILYAFNAANPATPLYASNQNPSRDDAGAAIKFSVPVVTNGKVYVGAGYQVDVYGLLNGEVQGPAPDISPSGGSYIAAQPITLTDSVGNATIYYTVDGTTPTTASTQYTGAFTVSSDATVQAIASAGGYLQSPVASATYSFNTQTAEPQFSPAAGTYTTTQYVTLADTTSGAQIYYTTDGSTPTTSSTRYTGPIAVSGNLTIEAIAASSGLAASNPTTASYSIQPTGTEIDFGNGFAGIAGLTLNGSATNANGSQLLLTTGVAQQAGSAFWNTPINIQSFTTDFVFQLSNALADGFTFTLQNVGPTAIGGNGGSLGYGPNPNTGTTGGMPNSVAIKFDIYSNAGEGTDSTGVFVDGAAPTVPAVDMTSSGVVLTSGDTIAAHMTYDGANLILTLTDLVVNKVFTHTFPINIAATIGSNLAYVGFTGGTGGETSTQAIESWTFTSSSGSVTQTPTFSPAAGTYSADQQVALSDGTAGAVIYYTTDGSTPTTASAVYSSPLLVSTNTTLQALAVAPGFQQSAVAGAAYVVQSGSSGGINFAGGFQSAAGLQLNGAGKVTSSDFLELTDLDTYANASAFWTTPLNIQAFTTNFSFQLTSAAADGFTFTLQNAGPTAMGGSGGSLGYGPTLNTTTGGIAKSVAIKFDIFNNSGEGTDSTGIFTDGAFPAIPAVDLTPSGIVLSSGDVISAQLVYDGAILTLNLTDTVTGKTFSDAFTIDIPSIVGGDTAYVGFTGGTGGLTSIQDIRTWTFTSGATQTAAEPQFSPLPGAYSSAQNVSLSSATPAATIYYTVDGSTPTHSSAVYTAPIVVNGQSLTIRAFASATGYQDSPIVVGSYQIQAVASVTAAPAFSPASETNFSSTRSVSIADASPGAAIFRPRMVRPPLDHSFPAPTYRRLTRVGATYTAYWSQKDGVTWNQVGTLTDSLVVTSLAPYASNYGTPPSLAAAPIATLDWFHDLTTLYLF